jgi:hypothetical protein
VPAAARIGPGTSGDEQGDRRELSLSVDAVKTHLRRLAVLLEVENLPQNRNARSWRGTRSARDW